MESDEKISGVDDWRQKSVSVSKKLKYLKILAKFWSMHNFGVCIIADQII
jgi:hypothetical protein